MTATTNGATEGKGTSSSPATPMRPSLIIPSNALVLQAVHDFEARSPDELTLRKGEDVVVLEQDDEFGDGWFLGRKSTGEQGLFPKVYTTATSSSTVMQAQQAPSTPSSLPQEPTIAPQTSQQSEASPRSSSSDTHLSAGARTPDVAHSIPTPPLSVEKASGRSTPTRNSTSKERPSPLDGVGDRTPSYHLQGLRSPVEDTLSDIEEAISEISNRQIRANKIIRDHNRRHSSVPTIPTQADMHHPPPTEINDSGSEYSDQDDDIVQDFGTDIDEEEDDLPIPDYEEDDIPYTKDDVMRWTPEDVSRYFQGRNLAQSICNKFTNEEVSGAVLLELEMSHLKELDIGSFGKRFEVWKEIEHLIKNLKAPQTRSRSGSDAPRLSTLSFASDSHTRIRSSVSGAVLPRIRSQHNRPVSRQRPPIDVEEANLHQTHTDEQPLPTSTPISSNVPSPMFGVFEQPRSPPLSPHRPHSPSVRRSFHESSPATALNTALSTGAAVLVGAGHNREGSFDRHWSSGAMAPPQRPSTATGHRDHGKTKHKVTPSLDTVDSGFSGSQPPTPNERSYFSSSETTRERKVLQKKGGIHQRHSSYTDETRLRSATAHSRHSIISADERTSSTLSAAATFVKGGKDKHKRKSSSFSGEHANDESPLSPVREAELHRRATDEPNVNRALSPTDFAMLPFSKGHRLSMTGSIGSTFVQTPESVGAQSLRSAEGSAPSSTTHPDLSTAPERPPKASRASQIAGKRLRVMSSGSGLRQKSKKQTSAFEKGVRNITPLEAAKTADYSGWLKKRGSTVVGAWKPRFFVLNGRRLSYFYSEKDTRERGLIDITSHKVAPCTDDRIVGMHAAFAAATSPGSSPKPTTSPLYQSLSSPQSPEVPSPKVEKEDKAGKKKDKEKDKKKKKDKDKDKDKEKHEGWFVFKLVPPGPGAAKGVTFTPPRLHHFATDTWEEGKKWIAALTKATIDRDETKPVVTSYNAKTISLAKARELRTRPPELSKTDGDDAASGLAICGVELGARDGDDADVEDSGERAGDRESKSTIHTDQELPRYEEKASLKESVTSADSPSERNGAVGSRSDDLKTAGEGITQVQAFGIVG